MDYVAPTPADLQALKNELGYTGKQMAALGCVGEQHWRKYTGGADPKDMPFPNLFHLAASLELSEEDLRRVHDRMHAIGARFDRQYLDPKLIELGSAAQVAADRHTALVDDQIEVIRRLQESGWEDKASQHQADQLAIKIAEAREAYDVAVRLFQEAGGRQNFYVKSRHRR